jgi:hypothetical protein
MKGLIFSLKYPSQHKVKGHVQKSAPFYYENIIQSRVPKISLLVKDIFYTGKASVFYRTLGEIPIEIGCFSSMFLVGTLYVFYALPTRISQHTEYIGC